jgi:hypothetical protein
MMTALRIGFVLALCLGGGFACAPGGPERASDIQNLHGISDDISAVSMTDSDARTTHDPNLQTTLPNSYQTIDNR